MVYDKQSWVNSPSVLSPLNAARLNHMETQYDEAVATAAAGAAAGDVAVSSAVLATVAGDLAAKAPLASPTFTGTVSGVTKTMVGLGDVDNTADVDKPVSTATQTALNGKADSGGILRGTPTKTFRTVACCLRLSGGAWSYLNDSGHAPDGVASVSVTADAIRVTYSFTATKVVTCAVTPDEMFAQADIRMGASVGLAYMDIKSLRGAAGVAFWDPLTLTTANANIWVFGLFEVA